MLDQKTGEIEEDKKRALREMMEKLADEIVQKKTALREKQLAEVSVKCFHFACATKFLFA